MSKKNRTFAANIYNATLIKYQQPVNMSFKNQKADFHTDKTAIAVITLIIAQIFWGTSYLFSEYALRVFPPATLVTIRLSIAAIILGVIAVVTRQLVRLPWKICCWLLLASFFEFFVYFLCEAMALQRLNSMVTSVILSFFPLITPLFSYLFLREKITILNFVGIVVSIVGVMMVIIEKGKLAVDVVGVLILCVALLAAVAYAMILRKVPAEYNTLSVVFYMFCIALVFFVPTCLLVEWDEINLLIQTPSDDVRNALLAIIALAITASCIAFLFYSYGVRVVGPNKASVFNNIQPAVTALFAWAIFDTPMTIVKVVGIVVVIAGMFIAQKK